MPFSICERDLDLIQLEELHADSGYADWLALRLGLPGHRFHSARHSVSATVNGSSGETDLMALYEGEDGQVAVLIEDKIGAAFAPRQAERYHERGAAMVAAGTVAAYRTLLVAPESYLAALSATAPWHARLAIEEITAWFAAREGAHARWRRDALQRALQRARRTPSASAEETARFSLAFAAYLAATYAPALRHNPGRDPSGPIIGFPGSSVNRTLWWKVSTCQMALQLMGPYAGLAERLELPAGIGLERAAEHGRKCDYLIAAVPEVSFARPFDDQLAQVEEALGAALRLLSLLPRLDLARAASETTLSGVALR